MSDNVISAENVAKRYTLSHSSNNGGYTTFRDAISRQAAAPLRAITKKIRHLNGANGSHPDGAVSTSHNLTETFWALRNVSFEVKKGDVVGIIGRNGAGKSTLLKILSRITSPTEGRIRIKGRIASLLEVGTGFHPELTGRENIYLNGAILGMSQAEIKSKFDEIVAFAEVERFLDTPVKRYSSGMYVRLAFAVAAHLEPEILIVDEVLAVGDAAFQKKCLGKMQDVAGQDGRTILFVSHNLDSIMRLCSRVIWLNAGSVQEIGPAVGVIRAYSQQRNSDSRTISLFKHHRPSWARQKAILQNIGCRAEDGAVWNYPFGSILDFECVVLVKSRISALHFACGIFGSSGFEIAGVQTELKVSSTYFEPGQYKVRVCVPHLRLAPGNYWLNLGLKSESGEEDFVAEAAVFEVISNETSAELFADTIRAACIPQTRFAIEPYQENISFVGTL
ncbi:MAG: ABC transporter ATP-binding protein [Verrucomicrobia bacterium]|nr:ABC transporter ATP-binding protein [Verrucomicrobiota bacterium]